MSNYPVTISQNLLNNRAAAGESRVVRVEVKGVHNNRAFSLSGKSNHRYLFNHHPKSGSHVLDVPESVWMEKNGWLARDIQDNPHRNVKLIVLVLPFSKPGTPATPPVPAKIPKQAAKPKTKTADEAALAVLGG